ncbi:hypothetical protein PILCRDRAFT_5816 [Piloderma croceum F 1598]|uniref:Uncharacterized protein n=1 Tax=Piloderma croceum (strain F 1598) TaxID=765440 RepID=A0A0C3C558_PILCF|nr:hypothetical protein PILCRDRAFT_5816 [Piloderma croceum F 1598]
MKSWPAQHPHIILFMQAMDIFCQYSVRNDVKLKIHSTKSRQASSQTFSPFRIYSHFLYPTSDASETSYFSADVTSCFSYKSLLRNGVPPKIKASFSLYCLVTELKEEGEEEKEPVWVYPEVDSEDLELCEDKALIPEAEEDIILFPMAFDRETTPEVDPFAFMAYK